MAKALQSADTDHSERENGRGDGFAAHSEPEVSHAGGSIAEAAAHTKEAAAEVIRDMTRRIADQGQEAVRLGLHAVAGANAPLVDVGYDQGHQILQTAARLSDICHDAVQRTADDIQALTGSYYSLGRGLQRYQKACIDLLSGSMENVSRKRQDFSRANSVIEFAEFQRDIYLGTIDAMLTGCATLLRIAGQISQDAMQPLRERSAHRTAG